MKLISILFPFHMHILGHKLFPLSPWTMLQSCNKVIQHRQVRIDEAMDISCRIAYQKKVPKGLELCLHTVFNAKDEKIWECMNIYFFPGKFGESDLTSKSGIESLPEKTLEITFSISAKGGFRLGRLVGDYNGIHYFSRYARLFGFKESFAHAQRTMAECLKRVDDFSIHRPVRLDFFLKGPVYYQTPIKMKSGEIDSGFRFDLFCGEDPRPCICGRLVNLEEGASLLE